jgi:hypothetical protein
MLAKSSSTTPPSANRSRFADGGVVLDDFANAVI